MGVALAVPARGGTPPRRGQAPGPHGPKPSGGPRPRSFVTGPWPLWMRGSLALPLAAGVVLSAPSAVSAAVAAGRPAARLTFEVATTADAHDAQPGDGRCADSSDRCTL